VNVCVVITVAMVILLRDPEPYGIKFMNMRSLIHGLLCTCRPTSIQSSKTDVYVLTQSSFRN
jgi:hypothetical protein